MNQRQTLLAGAIVGFLSVSIGAFGAHALKPMLTASGKAEVYELAVKYQFYHALALVLTGILMQYDTGPWLRRSAVGFLGGIVLFSGSLYLLAFLKLGALGAITPLGGILLLFGWASLAAAFIKKK
jgi:uncharacterized membrane protein YgdD (TMEM256/DUF423 family)